jgi:LuxR family maltose regulon positive regulatory protein
MRWFTAGVDPLTRTEADVLGLVDSGLSNREIAATLSISVGTVKCHLHRVYEKLQVRNRMQATHKAREHGNLSPVVHSSAQARERNFG